MTSEVTRMQFSDVYTIPGGSHWVKNKLQKMADAAGVELTVQPVGWFSLMSVQRRLLRPCTACIVQVAGPKSAVSAFALRFSASTEIKCGTLRLC